MAERESGAGLGVSKWLLPVVALGLAIAFARGLLREQAEEPKLGAALGTEGPRAGELPAQLDAPAATDDEQQNAVAVVEQTRSQAATDRPRAVSDFLTWATSARDAPERVGRAETCAPTSAQNGGVCERNWFDERGQGQYTVSYHPHFPRAVRLSTTFKLSLTCADIAPSRVLRAWSTPAAQKTACVLGQGALAEMHLLVVRAPYGTSAHLFFPAYLTRDPEFEELVLREGT